MMSCVCVPSVGGCPSLYMSVRVRIHTVYVYTCVWVREYGERENLYMCEREQESDCECVCVCVCVWRRRRDGLERSRSGFHALCMS